MILNGVITNTEMSYVCQSPNCKSENFYDNTQIVNQKIFTEYCTTLSQTSPKSPLNSFSLCTNFK